MFVVQTQDTQRRSSLDWLGVSPPGELEDQEDIGPESLCTTTPASPPRWTDGWTESSCHCNSTEIIQQPSFCHDSGGGIKAGIVPKVALMGFFNGGSSGGSAGHLLIGRLKV